MALEFYNYIKTHAEKIPNHPAIIDGDHTLTYRELLEQVEKFSSALTGQMVIQGASVHWLQRSTANDRRTAGNSPSSVYFTQVRKSPRGTSFSALHATVQA